MRRMRAAFGLAGCLCAGAAATATIRAQGAPTTSDAGPAQQLQYESGRVTVAGGIATIDLPAGWRYLQSAGARHVVEQVWRNRANPSTLGLVLPPTAWGGLLVSYDHGGFVTDDDSGSIDPDSILRDLQQSLEAANPARRRAGQAAVRLLGWAQPPAYDKVARKLSWGRMLEVEGAAKPTLNYDVRVLAADGALVLQAVADAKERERVVIDCQEVLTRIELAQGLRYADHDPLRHRRAGHGVAVLISALMPPAVGLVRLLVKPALVAAVVLTAIWWRRKKRDTAARQTN